MATEVVHIIDPDAGTGYDYDSLYDWEAAEQGDLTGVRDEISVAKCRCTGGTADGRVSISGWTTSPTQYVKIWTDPAESYRHDGEYPSGNKFRVENTENNSTISAFSVDLVIDGIASQSGFDGNVKNFYFDSPVEYNPTIKISNCIIKCDQPTNEGVAVLNFISEVILSNTIIYKPSGVDQGTTDEGVLCTSSVANVFVYNCTIFNFNDGIEQDAGTIYVKNCAVFGCADDFDGLTAGNIDNCASDDGDGDNAVNISPGGTETTDWAGHFVDYANGDFHLKSESNLIGSGANLYNDADYPFQDDIIGTDRGGSGADWDIGAFEYVAGGASAVPVHLIQSNQMAQLMGR